MGNKLTRGNLLATLKELKKMPRPKVGVSNAPASVQAIVGNSKPVKKVDTHSNVITAIQRRRALLGVSRYSKEEYKSFLLEFESFIADYQSKKGTLGEVRDSSL